MNGRVYDPQLGRFLRDDPHIQDQYNTQSYNRNSYVMNNPHKYTDPSGCAGNTNYPSLAVIAAEMTKAILADITAGLFSQMVIAYAVSYAVTYIATGSGTAAQGACTGLECVGQHLKSVLSVGHTLYRSYG
jgi:hypothetical protein